MTSACGLVCLQNRFDGGNEGPDEMKHGLSVGMNEYVNDEQLNGKTSAEYVKILNVMLYDE